MYCSPTIGPRSPDVPPSRPNTCGPPSTTRPQRYAAGDFVNQHPGGARLPDYVRADRPLDNQDLVV